MQNITKNTESFRAYEDNDVVRLSVIADLASSHTIDDINRTLMLARKTLGMDVAFVAEFDEGRMEFRVLEGDAESFGWREGCSVPLESTFCKRMVDGEIPSVIPDARNDERVNDMCVTFEADIGSYVGLPLRFSNGRVYGTLCCVSHSPEPRLRDRDGRFMEILARLVAKQLEREQIKAQRQRLEVTVASVEALVAALDARDGYTRVHSQAVVEHSVSLARCMHLPEREVNDISHAALLHDLGKIGVGDAILHKPGPLNDVEWKIMRKHPEIGERIIAATKGLDHLAPIVRAEHERWDGRGYPDGISGEEIPLASRIILVCDAFHAMTSDRPYRRSLDVPTALGELERHAGEQFCPRTVEAFVEMLCKSLR